MAEEAKEKKPSTEKEEEHECEDVLPKVPLHGWQLLQIWQHF